MAYSNVTPMTQQAHQKTWFQKFRGRFAAGTGLILAGAGTAHAEGLTEVGTAITGQLTASQAIIITVLVAAATITAIIIGYRKLNKGANAA
ncbi:hypothetical protein MKL33_15020 [Acinetobacter sp. AOR43_HL]|uniref:hypothetical protein n=1 Tax=Acinetobacter sp. AOR43_HL TaxID=2919390 RepID=UPI0022EB5A3A|nr:hypothetical protein [Acinetobacter sp. AOR43_HL]MDA3451972.1 hypothetical protein [Acinetobacter sp. AOR43_HL]MDA3453139.1 hypothetical protein [Acinetobacter sp. AOR43_HL]